MANQIVVTQSGNVQVAIEPTPNVQVQISRAAIGTVSNVPTANFANYAGNVTVAAQPNITSVGTLTGLTVSGNANVTNLVVTGNLSVGNLVANSANYANYANVSNIANSVAVANVTGIGNIATINLDGNVSNVLSGNGSFVPLPTVSANANYANFAGTAFNVSGANVSGQVANANYASFAGTAYSISGSNVVGEVSNANYATYSGTAGVANSVAAANVTGLGNVALLNLDGNAGNILYGNGSFSALPTISNVANANYANFANLAYNVNVSPANSSITTYNVALVDWISGGHKIEADTFQLQFNANTHTLTTGNLVATSNVQANYFVGAGNNLSNIQGANVSGEVSYAAVANSVALANVSGAGNIASINLDGSSSNVLYGNGAWATISIPSGTSISNGTSNVNIPVANGNVNISTNGNANIAQFDTNGALFMYPTTSSVNALRINSYGNPISGDVSRIASFRARGNAAAPLSVQPNDNLMRFLAFGYNGAGQQTNSVGSIRASVDNSYTANGANIPIGWTVQVNDTNGGVNNQTKNHQFYANGNVVFANSLFAVDSFAVGGNITSNTGTFFGNGAGLTNLPVANITGLGNIATINLDGNASNVLLGNGVFSSVPSTIPTSIANGTSNINIPTASSNILISTNGNANIVDIRAEGSLGIRPPAQGPLNAIRIETYGRSGNTGAQRISSFRYRGNVTTPLSVQPNDATMEFLTAGYNGSALQTSSIARIQATVDNSYTANGANIPLGWQVTVNDTNGGVNNQTKTHNFYSNGATALSGNLSATGGQFAFSNSSGGSTNFSLAGDKTVNSAFSMSDAQFSVTMSNVDTTGGFSPFRFQQYAPTNNQFGSMYMYRARGNDFFSSAPVQANDQVMSLNFIVNSNNTTTSIGAFNSTVTYNDNAGNVGTKLDFNASGTGTTGYLNGEINLIANTTSANNFTANNVTINNSVNGFMKLSSYTATALNAITGQIGWMAAVSDSGGGSNPNGMLAFWDTTNNRWSYIHDNTAV